MPRHLISDAHEWINEIPTVPHSLLNFLSPLSLPQGGDSLSSATVPIPFPLWLSELVSGSHMAMAGPSPHVPPLPLVPHSVPPLSSSFSCPDPTPRSTISPSSAPLRSSNNPRSEHLLPSSPQTTSDSLLHPPPPPYFPANPYPPLSASFTAVPIFSAATITSATPPPPSDQFPPLPSSQSPPTTSTIPSSSSILIQPPPPQPSGSISPPPKSYAQAAKSTKGTGFVRSHASEVESFARLPRIGANIICGSREGMPSFTFADSDLPAVEDLYSNALVMKFLGGRPSLEVSHREIVSWGLVKPFSIGPLTSRSFLLRFQDANDLIRVLSRPSTILINFPYKIFRWHSLCHIIEDSCYAPIWISLPRLPLQCFIPEFLEAVANKIGRFLCFDIATTTLARPSAARFCVEIDLRIPQPTFVWIGLFDGVKQPVIYEKLPKFCGVCHIQGHELVDCPKGQRETLLHSAAARQKLPIAHSQPIRRNASMHSSTSKQLSVSPQPHNPAQHLPQQPNPFPTPAPAPSAAVPPPPHQSSTTSSSTTTLSPILDHFQFQPISQRAPSAAAMAITPPPQSPHIPPSSAAPSPSDDPPQVQKSAALLQQDHAAAATSAAPSTGSKHQQTNIEANIELWEAVNRQVTILEQARVTSVPSLLPDADAARHPPPHKASPSNAALLQQPPAAAPSAAAPSAVYESAATSSPPATSTISAHTNDRMIPTATQSSKSLKGKHKSINFQPSEVGISASLTQQQRTALEKFKSKLHPSQIGGHHLSSVNHFEALRYDHSDIDGDGDVASYYSDTDDGGAEHIELGYQSANGRSSNKLKDFAPSGMRINKRHPNMPLRVKLRSRKDSHPSTP